MSRTDLPPEEQTRLEEANRLAERANELWLEGRYADTAPLYDQALTIVTDVLGKNTQEYAAALRNVANLYYVQKKYGEAESAYEESLRIFEREDGSKLYLVETLTWLAESRFQSWKYDEAEEPYQRAIAILEQRGESARERLAEVCMDLAHLYYFVGRYHEAEPQYIRALKIREEVLGPDDVAVAHSAGQLARMYHLNPDFNQDPEPLYLRALAIKEKVYGENHQSIAEAVYRLADVYRSQKRQLEAEPLYERAMAILDANPQIDEMNTRWMRSGYAEYLRETDRGDRAVTLETTWGEWDAFGDMCRAEVLARETSYGPNAPELAESLQRLGDACLFRENYDEAEQCYTRALSINETNEAEDETISNCLTGLARISRVRGNYQEAEDLIQKAASIRQTVYGTESIEFARTQEHLAQIATEQEQYQRAEGLFRQALHIYKQVVGTESREYAEGLYHFAAFYFSTSQFVKADLILKELMEISQKEIGVEEIEKTDYFQLYANVLERLGRTDEAAALSKRVEAIWSEHEKGNDLD